ncbi:hypothetical protein BY996DRAFT_6565684 [Phakopsora pachyrhizi]|nr:hypothetical protein BY996DRAFT_6565684 [Phakopsora pachyrhizi]
MSFETSTTCMAKSLRGFSLRLNLPASDSIRNLEDFCREVLKARGLYICR